MKQMNQKKKVLGQGMTEYIIIVALIAVSAIGAFRFFGQTARQQVAGLSTELSGQDAETQIAQAADAATGANNQAQANKTLSTYNGN